MMKQSIYKYEGLTVWFYSYHWTDDQAYNLGYDDNTENYIGTESQFREYVHNCQELWGFNVWNVTKRHATKEEYDAILDDL